MATLDGGRGESKQIWLSLSSSPCLSMLVWVHLLVARTLLMQTQEQREAAPWKGEKVNIQTLGSAAGSSGTCQRQDLDPIGMYIIAGNLTDYPKVTP